MKFCYTKLFFIEINVISGEKLQKFWPILGTFRIGRGMPSAFERWRICIVPRLLWHGPSVFCCLVQWTVTISMSVYYGMQGEKLFYRTWNPILHVVLEHHPSGLIYIALLNYHKSVKRAYFKYSPTSVNTFLDSCG